MTEKTRVLLAIAKHLADFKRLIDLSTEERILVADMEKLVSRKISDVVYSIFEKEDSEKCEEKKDKKKSS